MRRVTIVALAIASALIAAPGRAEIYRWVDDRGAVHLDDDIARVPEAQRPDARVFRTKPAAEAPKPTGPTQGVFADGVARELGLIASPNQDAVSALGVVGIYPANGWDRAATLSTAAVDEVARTARAAAQGGRITYSVGRAEAAVLRVASGLGVAVPPPTVVAEPEPPPEPPTIVVAPNIVVEAPPPATVIVHEAPPVLTRYALDPALAFGIPFATSVPAPRMSRGPIPRIGPLFNPAGQLRGPLVTPFPPPQMPRPPQF